MKLAFASLMLLAIIGNIFSHYGKGSQRGSNRLLSERRHKKHSESSESHKRRHSNASSNSSKGFEAVFNASDDRLNSAGQTSAIGKGKTAISSSIGSKGTINNLQSCKGGKAAQSFQQVADKKASSSKLRRGKNGKLNRIQNASRDRYNLKGANQNAFAGAGASSSATGRKGVISNVAGADGAANADSWNKIQKKKASSGAVKNAKRLPKRHEKHSESSEQSSNSHKKRSNQSNQSDQSDQKSNKSNQSVQKSKQSQKSVKKSEQSKKSVKNSEQSKKSNQSHKSSKSSKHERHQNKGNRKVGAARRA